MKKSKQLKEREDFIFRETLSELPLNPKSEDERRQDLFKDFDPDKMVDAYEEQLGIKAKPMPMPNLRYKNIMLSPGVDDEDSQLLNDLYNDHEIYHIVNRTNYWTPRGELKLFIEYTENMDIREERELQKKKQADLLKEAQALQAQQAPKETTNE